MWLKMNDDSHFVGVPGNTMSMMTRGLQRNGKYVPEHKSRSSS